GPGLQHLQRWCTEVEAMKRLRGHPNHVELVAEGHRDGTPAHLTRWCGGGSLEQFRGNPPPVRRAVRILLGVARGLVSRAGTGGLHRDLKSANVYLEADGHTARIGDPGLAKLLDDRAAVTADGQALGTPYAMAPEQRGRPTTFATDVWGFG